jgi:hypothetical protein
MRAERVSYAAVGTLPRMTVEPPPAPPARRPPWRRLAKRTAIVLGVVLTCAALLCCAGVGYLAYDANRAPGEERAMEAFADALCQDLVHRDADAVYAALSTDARGRYSAQALADGLAGRDSLTSCVVVRATYLFLLAAYVLIEDAHGSHTFDLVKEAGEWKVDSDLLHDLDSPPSHGGGGGGFGD